MPPRTAAAGYDHRSAGSSPCQEQEQCRGSRRLRAWAATLPTLPGGPAGQDRESECAESEDRPGTELSGTQSTHRQGLVDPELRHGKAVWSCSLALRGGTNERPPEHPYEQ